MNSQKRFMYNSNLICTLFFKYKLLLKFLYLLNDNFFFGCFFRLTFLINFALICLIITVVIGLNVQYIKDLLIKNRLAYLMIWNRTLDSLRFTRGLRDGFLFLLFGDFFFKILFFIDFIALNLLDFTSFFCDFLLFYKFFQFFLFLSGNLFLLRFYLFFAEAHVKFVTIFDHISKRTGFGKFISTALPRFSILIFLFFVVMVSAVFINDSESHCVNAL